VLLAAVSTFGLGGLWYSVLFADPWQRAVGISDQQLRQSTARVFAGSFVLAIVMAATLAAFIGSSGAWFGLAAGAAAGVCWVAAAFGVNYLFERANLLLFAINGGYHAVSFAIMGVVVGAMQA
jgi:hypothetical protein